MTNPTLTPDQISQFQTDGYTALPDLFTAREVTALRAELERFKREGLGRNVATAGDGKTHSGTQVNYQIIPLNDKSDLMRALPFVPKVVEIISQLIGTPFARQLDQIFLKPARSGAGTGWHTDNAYFKIADPTKGTAMWIALHDATLANGTLHLIPGSFRQSFAHVRDMGSDHHITFAANEASAVPLELPAGGAAFFNYGTAHATKANTTDRERAGLAFHYLHGGQRTAEMERWSFVEIAGPAATGGQTEYGVTVAGSWDDEVRKLVEGKE